MSDVRWAVGSCWLLVVCGKDAASDDLSTSPRVSNRGIRSTTFLETPAKCLTPNAYFPKNLFVCLVEGYKDGWRTLDIPRPERLCVDERCLTRRCAPARTHTPPSLAPTKLTSKDLWTPNNHSNPTRPLPLLVLGLNTWIESSNHTTMASQETIVDRYLRSPSSRLFPH